MVKQKTAKESKELLDLHRKNGTMKTFIETKEYKLIKAKYRSFEITDVSENGETWKVIKDYPSYMISSLGNIASICKNFYTFLKPRKTRGGYFTVALYNVITKERKDVTIHKLVAEAFLGYAPNIGYQINHKNFDKSDNSVVNLEWVSASENVKHYDKNIGRTSRGNTASKTKLTVHQVEQILALKGKLSQRNIAKMFGVSQSAIWNILKRNSWNDKSIELSKKRLNYE